MAAASGPIFCQVMLPMSTPILVVATILQVTGIWNDFIFGLTFAGRENLPMTVQLNNIVNSTQGERAYNVDMAATLLTAAGAAGRLLRLRALVRARHRRRRGEGLTAMGAVSVRDVTVAVRGASRVFDQLDLEVERGEFLVLLGPSGCGKSTLLNAIAGLLDVDDRPDLDRRAQRHLGGAEGPRHRHGVPVLRALPAHDGAREPVVRPADGAGRPSPRSSGGSTQAAAMLQIEHLLDRRPDQLSGGQRQRVAIGRALVRDADVFLFDEPLSNLDAQLRNELRVEIKRLHQRLGSTTMIYVTHDQIEALTLADRIAVMKDRRDPAAGHARPRSTTARPTCSSPASSARRA